MILEQSLIDPNFIGKDGFRWFVGQIPAGNSVSNGRCKVRIFGYHPADDQIKDKDLPWAHILVPPSFGSGAGYCGTNINVQSGTYVFGFFIDGEDAQQPVIVGAFYDDPRFFNVDSKDTYNKVLKAGTSSFKPFSNPPPRNSWVNPIDYTEDSSPKRAQIPGTVEVSTTSTVSIGSSITNTSETVKVPSTCESGKKKFNAIQEALLNFIKVLNTVQRVGDVYINPTLNVISDISSQAQQVAEIIGDILIGIVRGIGNSIIEEIYERLTTFFGTPGTPPVVKLAKHSATETVIDSILCAIEKILTKIVQFVFDFLMNIVEDVIAMPVCAVESLIGEMVGGLANAIDESIGPLLEQVTSLIGGTFGTAMSYLGKALSLAKTALSFLTCEETECYEGYNYRINEGWVENSDPNFERILGYAKASKLRSLTAGVSTSVSSWLGSVGIGENDSPYGIEGGSCNANIIECGLPTINIFGGGGSGATASGIVDAVGQIMGYVVTSGGSNYSTPPFISIESGCVGSGGAVAQAYINSSGQVDRIIPINVGKNYGGSSGLSGSVQDVIVDKTGIGYTNGDTITIPGTTALITPNLDPDGRIISVNIIDPGSSINTYPELQINTDTGYGAILKPSLKFDSVGITSVGIAKTTIVYCSEI